jgi:predicted nuclease with TOPRIM domain
MCCIVKVYHVVGDLSADKSSESNPVMGLCNECASSYDILVEETNERVEFCEVCGCKDCTDELISKKEELENELESLIGKRNKLEEKLERISDEIYQIERELETINNQLSL